MAMTTEEKQAVDQLKELVNIREYQTRYLMGELYKASPNHRIFEKPENVASAKLAIEKGVSNG